MKLIPNIRTLLILTLALFISQASFAKWYTDYRYNFKIDVPFTWKATIFQDGTDQVYDFTSPNESIFIEIRAFDAGQGFTPELIASVFEESMPGIGYRQKFTDSNLNGMHGKVGTYSIIIDGTALDMSAFYAVRNNTAFVIWSVTDAGQMNYRINEIDNILYTFSFLNPTTSSYIPFRINRVVMADQTYGDGSASHETTLFSQLTANIYAVVYFEGGGHQQELVARWVYESNYRVISEDSYSFKSNNGFGTLSLSRPNNGWPAGRYYIEFLMNGRQLKVVPFSVY